MSARLPFIELFDRLRFLTGERSRIALAFSGGLDSTALAHALLKSRRRFDGLRLLHVDHGLQAASAEWAKHCVRFARRRDVPIEVLRASVEKKKGDSPEAAARDARYRLLAEALRPHEVLVTAQHRDDQAETLLLQLFRGAGVAGLAAMPEVAAFGPGLIARPLLGVSRAEIAAYAGEQQLEWIEDPSNAQTAFGRNFLRHRVMPVIRERWPGAEAAIARSATHMAEAHTLLTETARADLAPLADGAGVSVAGLRALPRGRRRNALRAFIARAGADAPSTAQLLEIAGALIRARPDANPEQRFGGIVLRRRAGRLEVQADSRMHRVRGIEMVAKSWDWKADRVCILNEDLDRLELVDDPDGPIDLARLPRVLEIRARRGGETLRPGVRSRTQSLKKLLQAAHFPSEDRARLPLLFAGEGPKGRLIAAGDRWIDASIAVNVKSLRRARLRWTRG